MSPSLNSVTFEFPWCLNGEWYSYWFFLYMFALGYPVDGYKYLTFTLNWMYNQNLEIRSLIKQSFLWFFLITSLMQSPYYILMLFNNDWKYGEYYSWTTCRFILEVIYVISSISMIYNLFKYRARWLIFRTYVFIYLFVFFLIIYDIFKIVCFGVLLVDDFTGT